LLQENYQGVYYFTFNYASASVPQKSGIGLVLGDTMANTLAESPVGG